MVDHDGEDEEAADGFHPLKISAHKTSAQPHGF